MDEIEQDLRGLRPGFILAQVTRFNKKLNGVSHELYFFHDSNTSGPDKQMKIFSNTVSNSPKYSIIKFKNEKIS